MIQKPRMVYNIWCFPSHHKKPRMACRIGEPFDDYDAAQLPRYGFPEAGVLKSMDLGKSKEFLVGLGGRVVVKPGDDPKMVAKTRTPVRLGGGNSNIFYVHSEIWGNFHPV